MPSSPSRSAFCSGILLVVLFACTATYVAGFEWVRQLRLSPLVVGIVLGMIYANTLRKHLPAEWEAGVRFCSKQVLRLGIVLYGFQVTLGDVLAVGVPALVVDVAVVALTLTLGVCLGRVMRMDSQTAWLTSVGSSVCGAAAVLGAEPVVRGEAYKTAVAVSTVVIFGTLSMFMYPALYHAGAYDMDARQVGIYTGATLHEVAHVYGAGEAMEGTDDSVRSACGLMTSARRDLNVAMALHAARHPEQVEEVQEKVARMNAACSQLRASLCAAPEFADQNHPDIKRPAVIVKMIRVILLAPTLIVMSLILSRRRSLEGGRGRIQVPLFALFFLVVIGFNSLDMLPGAAVEVVKGVDTFLLTMAMTALGIGTDVSQFRKAGAKPFLLALLLFIWLVFGGYWLVKGATALLA